MLGCHGTPFGLSFAVEPTVPKVKKHSLGLRAPGGPTFPFAWEMWE